MKENYGNAYVNFGNAISIKDYFGDKINRSVHNTGPIHLQELTAAETKQIVKLAHTIIRKQRELTVINVFNLIALILNNNIKTSGDPVEINKLTEEVKWLFETVKVLVPKQTVLAINGKLYCVLHINHFHAKEQ